MAIDASEVSEPAVWRRWFAFLGGGVAWTFHLLAIYAVGEFGCVSGLGRNLYRGISAVAWLLIIVSVVSLVPAIAATVTGYRDARRDARTGAVSPPGEGHRYLSRYGWPLNAVFSTIIFVESLPVIAYLDGC